MRHFSLKRTLQIIGRISCNHNYFPNLFWSATLTLSEYSDREQTRISLCLMVLNSLSLFFLHFSRKMRDQNYLFPGTFFFWDTLSFEFSLQLPISHLQYDYMKYTRKKHWKITSTHQSPVPSLSAKGSCQPREWLNLLKDAKILESNLNLSVSSGP